MNKIYVATTSPRRIKLLHDFHFRVEFLKPCREHSEHTAPFIRVEERAKSKIECIKKQGLVIGFDTIVVLEDKILEKPLDLNEARDMILLLGGKWHEVITAIAIKHKDTVKSYRCISRVKFRHIDENEIDQAFSRYNPLDKAGAYGIQDFSAIFIEKIEGDYYNVVGLPITRFYVILRERYGLSYNGIFT